ncbi:hypothetical protein L1281_001731 [Neisseria sp. HSC-16F19]|nr:hypothetical protein [Neisseria sp. HSC-16F19]MCP2041137.1 hypothetical protein [Neisseria sp. HSC-16F19]
MNENEKMTFIEAVEMLEANIEAAATDPNHPYNMNIQNLLREKAIICEQQASLTDHL